MTKYRFFFILGSFVLFNSCLFNSGVSGSSSYSVNATTEPDEVSGLTNVWKVKSTSSELSLGEGYYGKTLYMVKINSSDSAYGYYQYVVTSASGLTLNTANSSRSLSVTSDDCVSLDEDDSSGIQSLPCGVKFLDIPVNFVSSSARSAASSLPTVTAKEYSVGETRDIYVGNDSSNNPALKTATLLAKGSYCYVWVIDEFKSPYLDSGSPQEIRETEAQTLCDSFENFYEYETYLLGKEGNRLIYLVDGKNTAKLINMSDVNDCGSIVNIVITDISCDNTSTNPGGAITGMVKNSDFFVSGDEEATENYYDDDDAEWILGSNKGNYFYIDAYSLLADQSDMISTLAHEFQHMIDFGNKFVEKNLVGNTAYTEMMSMMTEDVMQKKLDISNSSAPRARFSVFNKSYYRAGFSNYSSDYASVFYSWYYGLGAFLLRNYGGAALLKEMSTGDYENIDAIENAVKKVSGENISFEDLLLNFTSSLIFSDTSLKNPSLNVEAETSLTCSGYTYPATEIDIWNLQDDVPEFYEELSSYSGYKWDGPEYISANASPSSMKAYSFTLHKIGTIISSTGDITFVLSQGSDWNYPSNASGGFYDLDYYIMIQ